MAHFESLPTDLTFDITSYLAIKDLKALCLTSKTCQIIAEPALYSKYHQPILEKEEDYDMTEYQTVLPFLRTIVQADLGVRARPLGPLCRSVSISGWTGPYLDFESQDRVALTDDEILNFLDAALSSGLIRESTFLGEGNPSHVEEKFFMRFVREPRAWTPDALVVLLLSLLPNLAHLTIRDHTTETARLRWEHLCNVSVLQNLRILEIHGMSDMDGPSYDLNAFKPAFTLPNLRVLKASLCEAKSLALRTDSSHLEEITITEGSLGRKAIHSLVSACKKLRKFTYHTCNDGDCETTSFTTADLMKALRKHKACLTDLDVSTYAEDGECHRWRDPNVFCYGMALASFKCLRRIKAKFETLTGWPGFMLRRAKRYPRKTRLADALPCSIEELDIFDAWPNIASQLREVANQKNERFPSLRSINIECWKIASRATQRPLKATFRSMGVQLSITNIVWFKYGSYSTSDDEKVLESDEDSLADGAIDPGPPDTGPVPQEDLPAYSKTQVGEEKL